MKMKVMRLGYTEGTLFLLWYIRQKHNITRISYELINWLFSTSGYYDNEITGSYFNFSNTECEKAIQSKTFDGYMQTILNGIKNCDKLLICLHNTGDEHICKGGCTWHSNDNCSCNGTCNIFHDCCPISYGIISKTLVSEISPKNNGCLEIHDIHNLMENKTVLIVSPFAMLMRQQVLSGNCANIYSNFPKNVTIIPFQAEYTFFNKGNDSNILETVERYKGKIKDINFDLALVSCGAYSHLLVPFIADELNKDAITSFATIITDAFGIYSKRSGNRSESNTAKFWLQIPDEYKPENFMKIENGCYW